jgi:predicted lipoprotein with Yx(FWY)xxD motif
MRAGPLLAVLACAALLAACGEDESSDQGGKAEPSAAAPAEPEGEPAKDEAEPAGADRGEVKERPEGTTIVTGSSEFGEMLFDERDQAIYIFENDSKDETVCYDECAEAWPPVLTKGEPQAGDGVEAGLLGTIERDDGTTQVTYAGQPLYFYAHEAPGEVRCHNVNLNGGYWWVVGPDGERLA